MQQYYLLLSVFIFEWPHQLRSHVATIYRLHQPCIPAMLHQPKAVEEVMAASAGTLSPVMTDKLARIG